MTAKRPANRKLMREWNTKLILSLIRNTSATSQVEIFRNSGLSPATVTNITRDLRKQGLVKSVGRGESVGGRRPVILKFNHQARYVIAAGIFGSETVLAVVDLGGNILDRVSFSTRPERGCRAVCEEFRQQMDDLLKACAVPRAKVEAVGVGLAGVVDPEAGSVLLSLHLGWRNAPVRRMLEETTGFKAYVDSEGRTMALGEYWFGAGRDVEHMLSVYIEGGLGTASVYDGVVRYGFHHMEGEIGHIVAEEGGRRCRCGRNGCLEAFAAGAGMIESAAIQLKRGTKTSLDPLLAGYPERRAVRAIFEAAARGDACARTIVREAGRMVGTALANVVNYADPERIVLMGYVPEEDRAGLYLAAIRESFDEKVFARDQRTVDIVKGTLGGDAILMGGATMAYRQMFSLPGLS